MSSILNRIRWSVAPDDATPVQCRNFRYVQIDAIGIGLANAASPFLPVFLTRLGATNFQIGLLTAMPAATGLVLAIIVGNFLQKQRNVVPWFSLARLLVISAYAATGLAPFLVPEDMLIRTILLIWAVATLPQTAVAVGFSVVMNAVAGPSYRYDLMSRRWSILGLVTAITVAAAGQVLEWIHFPLNYQVVFLALSVGGLISYIFSSRIRIPDTPPIPTPPGRTFTQRVQRLFHAGAWLSRIRAFLDQAFRFSRWLRPGAAAFPALLRARGRRLRRSHRPDQHCPDYRLAVRLLLLDTHQPQARLALRSAGHHLRYEPLSHAGRRHRAGERHHPVGRSGRRVLRRHRPGLFRRVDEDRPRGIQRNICLPRPELAIHLHGALPPHRRLARQPDWPERRSVGQRRNTICRILAICVLETGADGEMIFPSSSLAISLIHSFSQLISHFKRNAQIHRIKEL